MAVRRSIFIFLLAGWLLGAAFVVYSQQKGVSSITAGEMRLHLEVIATDETQGRNTPSTAVNIVSRYLAAMVGSYGFKPIMPNGSFLQDIPLEVTGVSESKSRLRVFGAAGEEVFYCPESFGGTFRGSGSWSGDVVFVGYGLSAPEKGWDDYGDLDLAGKVVIMLEGQLPDGNALRSDRAILGTRTSAPRAKGAALVLTVVSPDREKDMLSHGAGFQLTPRTTMLSTYPTQNQARVSATPPRPPSQQPPLSATAPAAMPGRGASAGAPNAQQAAPRPAPPPGAAEIRHQVAAAILGIGESDLEAMFAAIARGQQVPRKAVNKRVELSVITEQHRDSSPNVLAVLEGSDPALKNEYVVITAHHDHLGMRNGKPLNGADDDGSGTVAMLEIAQALVLERPKRSVILAWVTGEEKGLFGSHHFVNNCPVPLEKISANLNLDMISRNDPSGLFLIASNNLSSELDGAIRAVNDKSSKLQFDYVYNNRAHPDRFYYRSDHYPFLRMGIPAVWLFCGTTPDYHTANDTIGRMDFAKMEKVTRLTYLVTLEIGNKPGLLKLDVNPEVTARGKQNTSVDSIR